MYEVSSALQVKPTGDLVLCKVAEAEQKTTGGIMLPTQAQRRPTSGMTQSHWWRLNFDVIAAKANAQPS